MMMMMMMMILLCSLLLVHVEGMGIEARILALLLEIVIRIGTETIMNFIFFCLGLDLVLFFDLGIRGANVSRKISIGWMLILVFLPFFCLL